MKVTKLHTITLIITVVAILFAGLVLFVNMKVHPQGVPYYQISRDRHPGGPFESSGSTSRYALIESIVKENRLYFGKDLASFASPDVGGSNPKFFTIFTPGVSFLAVPLYMFGQTIGYEQFTTYLLNVIFAIICSILIILILKKYGHSLPLQIASVFIFLFGTNAFVYSLYLTQHMIGAALVLAAVYICTFKPNVWRGLAMGIIFGMGILTDIPNAFMLFPAVLYYFFKHFTITDEKKALFMKVNVWFIIMLVGLIPLLMLFGWYNKELTGSPTQLPQFIGRVIEVEDTSVRPTAIEKKEVETVKAPVPGELSPFKTRLLLNGLYILLISDERGWLYYSPILFIGVLGMVLYYKKRDAVDILFVPVSIFIVNTLLYGMFGDPWGGWSFGARYMIPSAAVAVLFIPEVLERFKKNILVYVFVIGLVIYSIQVSTLGAVTTTEIPPKQEAEQLTTDIPYTYEYNKQLLEKNESYSMLNTYILKDIPATTIYAFESAILAIVTILPIMGYLVFNLLLTFKRP